MPKKKPIRTITVKDANSDTLIELDLSIDDEAFVIEYFNENMNATRAYLNLHPKAEYGSARSSGSQILAKPNIRARIDEVLKEKAMPRDEVLARLGDMARASHRPYIRIDTDGFIYFDFSHPEALANIHLIKKIKTKRERRVVGAGEEAETWEGEWVEVELHDPQKALELIGRYYKMFADKDVPSTDDNKAPFSIPAELIGKEFVDVYRDIRAGNNYEYDFDGGRGSLKSTFVSEVIVEILLNNPQGHALLLRQIESDIRDSVYNQTKWAITQMGLYDKFKMITSPMEMTYLPTGQKIYFSGASDPTSLKSIKPPFGHIIALGMEEFDQFRGEAAVRNIVQSALRGGDKAYRFATWNTPRTKNHWVHKYLAVPKEGRYHHHSTYLTTPKEWLGEIFLREAEYLKEVNPSAYEHEYLGIANGEGGMVFSNVVIRKITDKEIAQFDRIYHGLDFGYAVDPASYGKMHYDAARRKLYIFDEHRTWKKSNEDLYKEILQHGYRPSDLLIADSAEPKSIADLKRYGANCRGATKGRDSVKYSMRWLQGLVEIVIDNERAPYHAEEFINYEYLRTKDNEIISEFPDKNDHAISDTRYALNNHWIRSGE
jgi:phage terminase large subunit